MLVIFETCSCEGFVIAVVLKVGCYFDDLSKTLF